MKKITTIAAMVLASSAGAWAQDKAVVSEPVAEENSQLSVKEQIDKEIGEFQKLQNAFGKKVRAEKDRKKRMEIFRNERPNPGPVAARVIEIAMKSPEDAASAKGLAWGMQFVKPEQKLTCLDLLLKHHASSDVLISVASSYSRQWRGGEAELEKIQAEAKNPKVQSYSAFFLAEKLIRAGDAEKKAKGLAGMKKLVEGDALEKLDKRLFQRAKNTIFVEENLAIGCVAPDIVGTDHAGVEFKLSDYKGKVVLLDFWGHW